MKKRIKVGDKAPVIDGIDLWGNIVNVPSAEKWTFLSFHRFAACPFCNVRTNELKKKYDLFEKYNTQILSIWPSAKELLLRYAGSDAMPFPLLSDKEKLLYKEYGVLDSSLLGAFRLLAHPKLVVKAMRNVSKGIKLDRDPTLLPAGFLIDPNGIVQLAYYGKHYGDHPSIETIIKTVE